jgi:hypothetical protein
MNSQIQHIFQTIRLNNQNDSPLSLREGQIITGKVARFLPDNKAIVQLANQTVIADVKHSLLANQRYMFQVKQLVPMINLQVVSERPVQEQRDMVEQLLRKLGLKATESRRDFLSLLLKHHIPFQSATISQAIQLLDRYPDTEQTKMVLLEMLKRNLPMQKDIFDALFQRIYKPISLHDSVQSIMEFMKKDDSLKFHPLRNFFSFFQSNFAKTYTISDLSMQLLWEVTEDISATFHLLQKAGFTSKEIDFQQWKKIWLESQTGNQIQPNKLAEIMQNANVWKSSLNAVSMNEFFNSIQNVTKQLPLLTKEEINLVNVYQLFSLTNEKMEIPIQTSFITKIKGYLSLLQLTNKQGLPVLLKSLQELMLHQSNEQIRQEAKQIANILYGTQLTLVEENEWLQFSVQIPGIWFGLKKDIIMDMEGKKGNKDHIDASYCRIMFYLELEHLREIIVDMMVQNKIVSLSIYHDEPHVLNPIVEKIKPILKAHLQEKQYPLSSVIVKEFPATKLLPAKTRAKISYQGVDIQI